MLHPMNDGTLDVLILGPMGAGVAPSEQNCVRLKAAVEELLARAEFTERLRACGYQRFNVTAPEHLQGNRIANEVFRELDKADLVVLDLSSRPGTTAPSPNVMYELALVHALGLPFMLISSTMDPAPFYVAHDRVRHAAYDKLEATAAELYGPFAAYLDPKNRQNFADNAVWEMKALARDRQLMPWRIEDEMKKIGANYVQAGLWRGFAVRDGNLITGQQQYSGTAAARLVIDTLGR